MADENRRLTTEVRTANQELASANRELEILVREKQQQIRRREVSLDIVREALQNVPLPIIGLDEEKTVVFANGAAGELFAQSDDILGNPIDQFIPDLAKLIPDDEDERVCIATVNGIDCSVQARRMGHGTQSRGTLMTFAKVAPGTKK
jgi:PAS domain-containing protein